MDRELGLVWQVYVGEVWVSTIYRASSALDHPSNYFETMAFRATPDSSSRPHILWHSAAPSLAQAERQHALAVRWFESHGPNA